MYEVKITRCALVGGGPLDGCALHVCAERTLLRTPLCIADDPSPGGILNPKKFSARWVHAYVRMSDGVFSYDGIREK